MRGGQEKSTGWPTGHRSKLGEKKRKTCDSDYEKFKIYSISHFLITDLVYRKGTGKMSHEFGKKMKRSSNVFGKLIC